MTTFDARIHCGARSKRTGQPCLQHRGQRTEHPRVGRCWLHGGRTPNGRQYARREAAENALRTLQIEASVDPIESLFEAVRVAAWRELGLRLMVQGRHRLINMDHLGDQRPDVISTMHHEALELRAKVAKMAVEAGLDRRIVELAERQAEIVMRALEAALGAAGTDPDAADRARAAFVAELRGVAPVGVDLN